MAKIRYNVFTENFDLVGEGGGDLPLKVKGDLLVHDGVGIARFPVEEGGRVLVSDPASAAGVSWKRLRIPFVTADGQIRDINLRQD